MMVPLIEEPPWTRRRTKERMDFSNSSSSPDSCNAHCKNEITNCKKKADKSKNILIWEKLNDQYEWTETPPTSLLRVTQFEAQPWLAIYHLTCHPSCREAYSLDTYRKETLLRLRKYLNETLIDQLPVLADVMRYMDELSILSVPTTSMQRDNVGIGTAGFCLLQQVDTLRDDTISTAEARGAVGEEERKGGDSKWLHIADAQFREIFSNITDSTDLDLRFIAEIYNEENVNAMFGCTSSIHNSFNTQNDVVNNEMNSNDEKTKDSPTVEEEEDILIRIQTNAFSYINEDETFTYNFSLVLNKIDDKTVVNTPYGVFQRHQLQIIPKVLENDGMDMTNSTNSLPLRMHIREDAIVEATLNLHCFSGVLQCDLDFVRSEVLIDSGGNQSESNAKSKRVWRQLGSIQTGIALQLGFQYFPQNSKDSMYKGLRQSSCSLTMDKAFLSYPLSNT